MILQANALTFNYLPGQWVLQDISLSVEANSILYLLGHNGCGKTTLLEILGGLRAPKSGDVWLNGTNVHRLPAHQRARHIGMVPQMHIPVFAYNVRQVVLMGRTPYMRLFGTPGKADYEIVDHAIETVGLTALRERAYTELSGGERQLTLIARGLAQQTNVLLLDEPTAHLDPRNQRLVLETVLELAAEQDVSFVISSHNPNSALLYADHVMVMKAGRVVAFGTPLDVLTEETLSMSYDMPVDVIYNHEHVAQAIMPRRNGASFRHKQPGGALSRTEDR
ncbi:MAG: ABC transporter ATP-binding protein [Anaerolineae bacterium]|nr:ABC transporter ATP-binding protein [Anaerolineae bacterium]